jgi:PTH1 family peptidyl-tRNA hydrolase
VHDDIDLAFGRIKIKEKGGHGGHKGIQSIMAVLGGGEFLRLRIGIGRSVEGMDVSDFVLGKFKTDENTILAGIIARACDAVALLLCKSVKEAMNVFNRKEMTNAV